MVNVTITMLRAWSKSSSGVPAKIHHIPPKQVVCYTVVFCVVTKRPSPLAWWHKKRLCSKLQKKGQVPCRLCHGETHWNQGDECKMCKHYLTTRWYLKVDGRMPLSVFNKLTESLPLWGSTSQSLKHKATVSPSCTVMVNITLGLKGLVISGSKGARHSRASIFPGEAWKMRETFHLRGHHLWQLSGTKESIYLRKEFNSHRIGLENQHGHCLLFWNTKMIAASFLAFLILLHFLHIFRKASVLNTANKNLSWYSSTKVNREFKQHGRRRLRKRHFQVNSRCFKLYRAYSISFNSSNVGDFFWSWILRDCI